MDAMISTFGSMLERRARCCTFTTDPSWQMLWNCWEVFSTARIRGTLTNLSVMRLDDTLQSCCKWTCCYMTQIVLLLNIARLHQAESWLGNEFLLLQTIQWKRGILIFIPIGDDEASMRREISILGWWKRAPRIRYVLQLDDYWLTRSHDNEVHFQSRTIQRLSVWLSIPLNSAMIDCTLFWLICGIFTNSILQDQTRRQSMFASARLAPQIALPFPLRANQWYVFSLHCHCIHSWFWISWTDQ